MESDIKRWLNFAVRVETQLQSIDNDIYSENYIAGISTLLKELRKEAEFLKNAELTDQQECYFKVNQLSQKLRNTAHFAHHA